MEWEHEGFTIRLDDRQRFVIVELEKTFDTMRQAKDAAESAAKVRERVGRRKLDIAVLADGKPTKIVGVHAGHGKFMLSPKVEDRRFGGTPELYIGVEWISQAIQKRIALMREVERINDAIEQFKIDRVDSYRFDTSKLPAVLDALEKQAAQKRAIAEKTTLENEIASLK
jgi:hypothetical protein